MTIPAVFAWPAADADSIAALQTTSGSGSFILNGDLVSISPSGIRTVTLPGIQRTVSLTSTGNISGVNFTIVGTDTRGAAVTETRAGPNNNTVETTATYHTITSVTVNGAVGTNTSVGTGTTGSTRWYAGDIWQTPFQQTLQVEIPSGTINVTVQATSDDVNEDSAPVTFNHPTMAAITASTLSNWAFPCRFTRMVVNSATDGLATFTVIQANN